MSVEFYEWVATWVVTAGASVWLAVDGNPLAVGAVVIQFGAALCAGYEFDNVSACGCARCSQQT